MVVDSSRTHSLTHSRFQTLFLKVVHKLHKEHISSTTASADAQAVSDLLQLSLELMKDRVTSMPQDARKGFFTILSSLIEKSSVLVHVDFSILMILFGKSNEYPDYFFCLTLLTSFFLPSHLSFKTCTHRM